MDIIPPTSTSLLTQTDTTITNIAMVRSIDVVQLAESRSHEIKSMEKALRNATEHSGMQRVFQKLPRHMRRRAASHNVNRVPQKYRQKAIEQVGFIFVLFNSTENPMFTLIIY